MKPLSKLFSISYGTKLDANDVEIADKNEIMYVSRSAKKNGIKGKVAKDPRYKPNDPLTITVPLGGEGRLTAYLQFAPYYNGQNIAILTPINKMSITELLYYTLAIRSNQFRYSAFGREANVTLGDILLPEIKELPPFLKKYQNYNFDIDINKKETKIKKPFKYKKFNLLDLFNILEIPGSNIKLEDAVKFDKGDIAVVSSKEKNNGISKFISIDSIQNYAIYPENCFTLAKNGTVGVVFFQETKIVTTTDVIVLKYKYDHINKWIGLYYKILIEKSRFKFNYGRKISGERPNEIIFNVPVTNKEIPDHKYMEELAKSINISSLIEQDY